MPTVRVWLLSIMLCLKGSRGTLESGLKHGIKLRKDSEGAAGAASPATVLERRDGHSELKLQGILGMEIATTIPTHDLQLAIDGLDNIGGGERFSYGFGKL